MGDIVEFAIAKVSTKGQIVIPRPLRENISTGDEFLVIRDNDRIILKNMRDMADKIKEDFVFAERVEEAWEERGKGSFESKSKENFIKELRAC